MIKYIARAEYEALWEDCKSRRQYTSPNLDPSMKQMTVRGLSGVGTDFANEYERLLFKSNNPDIPREICYHTVDGPITYRVDRRINEQTQGKSRN